MITTIDDSSEFAVLIRQVVHKEIPAFIDGTRVFQTNGVPLKKGGVILREIQGPDRNDPCYCGSNKKFKKCCINLEVA